MATTKFNGCEVESDHNKTKYHEWEVKEEERIALE